MQSRERPSQRQVIEEVRQLPCNLTGHHLGPDSRCPCSTRTLRVTPPPVVKNGRARVSVRDGNHLGPSKWASRAISWPACPVAHRWRMGLRRNIEKWSIQDSEMKLPKSKVRTARMMSCWIVLEYDSMCVERNVKWTVVIRSSKRHFQWLRWKRTWRQVDRTKCCHLISWCGTYATSP